MYYKWQSILELRTNLESSDFLRLRQPRIQISIQIFQTPGSLPHSSNRLRPRIRYEKAPSLFP